MHKRWYYRNSNGDLDPHAQKMAWKYHDLAKFLNREEARLGDWNVNNNYSMDVTNTLWVNTQQLDTNRENTKLALRQPLSIVPRDEIAGAIIEGNFSMVPMEKTPPSPVKPEKFMLLAA